MNAMTIKELIEKLRKEYGADNGCYYVLQNFVQNIEKYNNYESAYGFIYGLHAVNYINEKELRMLTDEILEIWKQRV